VKFISNSEVEQECVVGISSLLPFMQYCEAIEFHIQADVNL
jgi:hypothetical protein